MQSNFIVNCRYKPILAQDYELEGRKEKISHCSLRISRLPCVSLNYIDYGSKKTNRQHYFFIFLILKL